MHILPSNSIKSIIVTGAAGYIGSHFMRAISGHDYRVIAVDRSPIPYTTPNVIPIVGDLIEQTTLVSIEDSIKSLSPEAIYWFHFAALFPKSFDTRNSLTWEEFETNNVQVTRKLITVAQKHEQTSLFFFPSTAHLNRKADVAGVHLDFYGRSKDINEKDLLACHNLRTVVWRLPRIIGNPSDSIQSLVNDSVNIDQLYDTVKSLSISGELPEDIVSIFLLRAAEDSQNPTLSITNATLKRTYAYISELTESLLDLIGSDANGCREPTQVPFHIEELSLYQIGALVVGELRANGMPIRFLPDNNQLEIESTDARMKKEEICSVVQKTVREYLSLTMQHRLLTNT